MANPLFQNILPEDIPVMLKRLNAYTKSYQKEEYIKHAGDPADFIGIIESGSKYVYRFLSHLPLLL
jgi:CRP-like cAMP-binding protein